MQNSHLLLSVCIKQFLGYHVRALHLVVVRFILKSLLLDTRDLPEKDLVTVSSASCEKKSGKIQGQCIGKKKSSAERSRTLSLTLSFSLYVT